MGSPTPVREVAVSCVALALNNVQIPYYSQYRQKCCCSCVVLQYVCYILLPVPPSSDVINLWW